VKLAYLITEDWFFCSHFIERASAARRAGYDVAVITRPGAHVGRIRDAGLRLVPLAFERGSVNPLREARTLGQVIDAYRAERPQIVHHVALKPILYGTIAARRCGIRAIVNAPVGMGFVYSSSSLRARALRPLVDALLRRLLNPPASRVVFENPDDRAEQVARGAVRAEAAAVIRGAGVDLERFRPVPEPADAPVVVLVSRMLWDKGVGEFVEAARRLRAEGVRARFLLVGGPDEHNPASVEARQLEAWAKEGAVEWLGWRDDVPAVIAASHIVCLPSYREGLPKTLLEALASGRAVVATDVAGCREAVRDGDNGLLVPPRDAAALAAALKRLITDAGLRRDFGARGRERAEREFSLERIVGETLGLYQDLLAGRAAA
jgi:glycosyltransferase involved in cell wall biosynthesis